MPALGHHVSDHAVKAQRGKQGCEQAEAGGERRHQPLAQQRFLKLPRQQSKLDADAGVDLGRSSLHVAHHITHRTGGAQHKCSARIRIVVLCDGEEPDRDEVFPQFVVFRVLDQANDLAKRFRLASRGLQAERAADGVGPAEEPARELLVYNRHFR